MMSCTVYRGDVVKGIAVALLLAGLPGWGAAESTREAMKREEARLLETTVSRYDILQSGTRAGYESVTRRLYSNNTIIFDADIELMPAEGVLWNTEVKLVIEEDSHFPRSYEMKKEMTHQGRTMEQSTRVEMVANVAVVTSNINQSEETRNVVLPAGTPVFESGALHLVHQLLFWYDRGTGGRQRFTVFDPLRGQTSDFVMLLTGAETIDVMGAATEVEVFQLEQGAITGRYFLDANGRLVGADLGFLTYLLSDEKTLEEGEG